MGISIYHFKILVLNELILCYLCYVSAAPLSISLLKVVFIFFSAIALL